MARIVWDANGEKLFESGIDHAVLYLLNNSGEYTPGVPWNGVTSIAETPEGGEPESQYADNIKYLTLMSAEELNGTIEAYTYPDKWAECDGSVELSPGVTVGQQKRKTFGLSYRTKIGNDVDGQDHGYKLHLLYGALASPSERTYETINDSPEAITFSWEYSTTPVPVANHLPTALLTIDSTKVDKAKLLKLEEILYGGPDNGVTTFSEDGEGSVNEDPRLPLPDEVVALLAGEPAMAAMARMNSKVRI